MTAPVVDSERVVLGAMMSTPDAVVAAAGVLSGEDFYRQGHRAIFDAVRDLWARNGPTDPVAVHVELHRRAEAEHAAPGFGVGAVYLAECVEAVPTTASVGWYAAQVRQAADDRRRGEILTAAAARVAAGENAAAVASWVTAELGRVGAVDAGPGGLSGAGEDAFWSSRKALRHVRDFARARMASPWAVLGVVLVRVLSQVPPTYRLPAVIGSEVSLNLFVAIVAPSGGGKGAAEGAARDAVDVGDVTTVGIGSGEGVLKSYVHRDRDGDGEPEIVRHTESVVFTSAEVDTFAALTGRQGSTLLPMLRQGWMGEEMGFGYADLSKRLTVSAHDYRMGLVVGVQPGRAEALLNERETAGGTPQRFLWLPGTDPGMPDVTPPEPAPMLWARPGWPQDVPFTSGRHVLDVCDVAVTTIREAHRKRQRGDADALDGHALLCREKLAAALGLLDGHARITAEDWQLAGVVMAVSDQTRRSIVEALRQAAAARNRERAEADAERAVVVTRRTDDEGVKAACAAIMRRFLRADAWVSHSDLRGAVRRHRNYFDDAIDRLVDAGQVEVEETEYQGQQGKKYRRVGL